MISGMLPQVVLFAREVVTEACNHAQILELRGMSIVFPSDKSFGEESSGSKV